jgi:hypothetical protein
MSSWGAPAKTQMKKKPDGYFFQPSVTQDICTVWNQYLEKWLFAIQKQKTLFVMESALEPGFKVLQNIFRAGQGVEFVDLPNPYYINLESTPNPTVSIQEQRHLAKDIFTLRKDVEQTLKIVNSNLPEKFDVGIYIDPIKHLPTEHYISLLHGLTKGAELHIFIMSSYPTAVKEFQKGIQTYELPWTLYHSELDTPKSKSKKVNTIEFLSEVENMKHARIVICGTSTPLGQYLYRTCDYIDNFIGIEPL